MYWYTLMALKSADNASMSFWCLATAACNSSSRFIFSTMRSLYFLLLCANVDANNEEIKKERNDGD